MLMLPALASASFAGAKPLTVAELNSAGIVGELGVPLHTVHRVMCRVVDMSFTRMKADDGRLAFQIISVDGSVRKETRHIDIPASLGVVKPRIGQSFHFWAYETVAAAGYPTEAFRKIGEQAFTTEGLHFRSKLVVLKMLDTKQEQTPDKKP